jgi:hypothetical protein
MIEHFREAIDLEEALRAVTVRLPATPIAVTRVRREPTDAASVPVGVG